MSNYEALGEDERIARGKSLREKQVAEELAFEERKAQIPELLSNSEHENLGAFVTAHSVERNKLEARGSFEQDHRAKLAEVSLTHRAAADLLLEQMTEIATSPGSSWGEVGISLEHEAQIAEEAVIAQPTITEYRYSAALGTDRTY